MSISVAPWSKRERERRQFAKQPIYMLVTCSNCGKHGCAGIIMREIYWRGEERLLCESCGNRLGFKPKIYFRSEPNGWLETTQ